MSIFLPYSPTVVVDFYLSLFNIDLTNVSSYELLSITILSNLYFFIFWGFIIYFSLKGLNWVYERLF